eukprot:CAMPEP_0196162806 /NCGR_PEP_ID=MMETSP0910-20130528/48020_1 /TAXON_ID=49265 /ORGANISM="Thalassiosira rotula, Strain GSO102" /LENGTH=743 /DNA_ID=CAMNT_0041427763 /DNA_START=119 /DNA_END=2349 /DNA_ORIENTATION=-
MHRPHASEKHAAASAPTAIILVLVFASFQPFVEALALPSYRRKNNHHHTGAITQGNTYGMSNSRKSEMQIYSSMGWTMDMDGFFQKSRGAQETRRDGFPSTLSHVNKNNNNNDGRRQRGLFSFGNQDKSTWQKDLVTFGPVPRGGSLSDIALLPTTSLSASGSAAVALEQPRQPLARVRSGVRGVRRGIVRTVVKINRLRIGGGGRHDAINHAAVVSMKDSTTGANIVNTNINSHSDINTNSNDGRSMMRVGGKVSRLLRRRQAARSGGGNGAAAMAIETVDKINLPPLSFAGRLFHRRNSQHNIISAAYDPASSATASAEALSSRGGTSVAEAEANKRSVDRNSSSGTTSSSLSSPISTTSYSSAPPRAIIDFSMMETYVIETPLFPIILPKAFEPLTSAASVSASSTETAASTTKLEISVALEEATSAVDTNVVAQAKPSPQLLQAVTLPLLPKTLMQSFTGRELYYPESIEALATTGMRMTLGEGHNEWVQWSGEKKTDNFLRIHGIEGNMVGNTDEWYAALDSSQEVLVWAGKSVSKEGYGAELPIIKTTSIIRQSPKYLAELLMDSSKVKVYNKMSLGRTDEKVFQTGVDTQEGSFGDGESKVVRNLTKPPMVSSIIEFVTCMHARKLRPSDSEHINGDGTTTSAAAEGYVVVSRAVTGGEWGAENKENDDKSKNGEKLVRNEILLGVNVLRAVPGEPNKTELTSVTHVYSPMIPLMLAKNAGVKGAVDFVRDIRALP